MTSPVTSNPEIAPVDLSETASSVPTLDDPITERVMEEILRWYRQFLTEVRLVGAKMAPLPSPDDFDDDEYLFWQKRFAKWLNSVSNHLIFNSIAVSPNEHRIMISSTFSSEKANKTTIGVSITRAMWDMFWSRDQERILEDDYFRLTDSDRQVLTAVGCLVGMNGYGRTFAVYWNVFQLSATALNNGVIYSACIVTDLEMFHEIQKMVSVHQEPIVLKPKWCYFLSKISAKARQADVVAWLKPYAALTKCQEEKIDALLAQAKSEPEKPTLRLPAGMTEEDVRRILSMHRH